MAFSVVNNTFVVTKISFLGPDIRLLMAKVTSVAVEITFKLTVITSSLGKISLFSAKMNFILAEMINKVAVVASLVVKITFGVTMRNITFLGADIEFTVSGQDNSLQQLR